jgi:hypothetical protein
MELTTERPNQPAAGHTYRIRSHAVDWLDVEEQVIALDAEKSVYVSTNSSGAILWHSLVDGATTDELAQQLVAAYGIAPEQAADDVRGFLDMLDTQGLLQF